MLRSSIVKGVYRGLLNICEPTKVLSFELINSRVESRLLSTTTAVSIRSVVEMKQPFLLEGMVQPGVLAFCPEDILLIDEVKAGGADVAGGKELIKAIQAGEINTEEFEYVVAHPSVVPELTVIRGLMKKKFPTVRNRTVSPDLVPEIRRLKSGIKIHVLKNDRQPDFGYIGTIDMDGLIENFKSVLRRVANKSPTDFVLSCVLKTPVFDTVLLERTSFGRSVANNYFSPKTQPADEKRAKDATPEQPDKPNPDQLQRVSNILQQSLEKLFTQPLDYSIYHSEIVFIDNIRNLRAEGLPRYIQQVALLRTVGHIKFAFVKFEVINMSTSPEEGRITIRWRIKGLSGLRVMLKFWKYKLWKWQELMNHQETWYDGVSYYDVGGDGKIVRHIADKVMEDKHRGMDVKSGGGSIPLAAKLGTLAAICPTPFSG